MNKLVGWSLLLLFLMFPCIANAEKPADEGVKVAFERDGYLWTKIDGREQRITDKPSKYAYPPQWSHDGKLIAYLKEMVEPNAHSQDQYDIWVYNTETKKRDKIFSGGSNPKWSPTQNVLAFKSGGVLNVSDLNQFNNVALGVDDYNWFPDGKSFIASGAASLMPDGWTNPILYRITLPEDLKNIKSLTDNVKRLFVIPGEVAKGSVSVPAINASNFEFSTDGNWISFIVCPTASWSMDSNMICAISADGEQFEVIDEMIFEIGNPQWAPSKNLLAYIAGGGRIVMGFKNKDLKITEFPAFKSLTLTPPGFAEMGFTWIDDRSFIVSRVKETEWSNDPAQHPKKSLYYTSLDKMQKRLTDPPGFADDVDPEYIPSIKKVAWIRRTGGKTDLWRSEIDGRKAEIWIRNIGVYSFFPEKCGRD
ncbi:TolB family protein [Bacillus sp. T33-2]|uniref:TolB family protein n=1 Tax=Bacillus sp. T33-2 TaxID=2054168 RepID=UPI000C78406C|nr:TolB domain-containing protein [Bacillus sp. T33-2]PLR95068.1 TolB domain-containing protein [Bacillus sp. T33-2]